MNKTGLIGPEGQPIQSNQVPQSINGQDLIKGFFEIIDSEVIFTLLKKLFNKNEIDDVLEEVYDRSMQIFTKFWDKLLQNDIAGYSELKKQIRVQFNAYKVDMMSVYENEVKNESK